MYCGKCGTQMSEDTRFCGVCGAPMNGAQKTVISGNKVEKNKSKKNSRHKYDVGLLAIAILAVVAMVLALLDVIPSVKDFKAKGNYVFEGEGFDSPEYALGAYINYMSAGDINGMLSTFAIESYVDHFDTKAMIQRIKFYQPRQSFTDAYELSDGSEYDRNIRIEVRRAALLQKFYDMLAEKVVKSEGKIINYDGNENIDSFMKSLIKNDFLNDVKSAKFIRFVEADDISNNLYNNAMQRDITSLMQTYNCEDIKDVVAILEIKGQKYYQCAQCVKYDGKWYILTLQGTLAYIIGADSFSWGLVPYSDIG